MTSKTTLALLAILILATGMRVIGITHPLIGHHSWRQTDTAAVARNFAEERFNLLYPRIDWRGAESGEVECEFPIYQFTVASLYRIFGVHEALARLLSLTLSLATIVGIYLLSKRIANTAVGLWAAFYLAILPMPVFFGRAVMPEALLLAACTYALLFFVRWFDSGSRISLLASAIALTVACLLKPPTLYLGLPLAYLAVRRHSFKAFVRPELLFYASFVFASLALWYTHAHSIKDSTGLTFGVWEYGSDKWGNWDLVLSWNFWETMLVEKIPHVLVSYAGLPLFIIGLVRAPHSSAERAFALWLTGMLVLMIVVAKGVYVHDYYLLPATIPAAYFMAKATAWGLSASRPPARWVQVCVAVLALGTLAASIVIYQGWLRKEAPSESMPYQLALAARSEIPEHERVVAVDRGDPLIFYYSRTKGWRSYPGELTELWMADRIDAGARYILGIDEDFERSGSAQQLTDLLGRYAPFVDTGTFFILKVDTH